MVTKSETYYAEIKDDRNAWKAERLNEFARCWMCGTPRELVIHEMAKKSQAPNTWAERCNYFLACNRCNCTILESLDVAVQLAVKRLRDPDHYDRVRVNALRGRAPNAVSDDDVASATIRLAVGLFYRVVQHKAGLDVRAALEALSNIRDGNHPNRDPATWAKALGIE